MLCYNRRNAATRNEQTYWLQRFTTVFFSFELHFWTSKSQRTITCWSVWPTGMWYFELKFLIMLDFFFNHLVDCKNDFRVTFCGELSINNVTGCNSECEQSVDCNLYFRVTLSYVFYWKLATKCNSKVKITIDKTFQKVAKHN